jgi:hypothetical protein
MYMKKRMSSDVDSILPCFLCYIMHGVEVETQQQEAQHNKLNNKWQKTINGNIPKASEKNVMAQCSVSAGTEPTSLPLQMADGQGGTSPSIASIQRSLHLTLRLVA